MKNTFLNYFIILSISLSLSEAEQSPEHCERGHFQLSLFGEYEKWNTSYYLDSSTCNATDKWKLILQQNVTEGGGLRLVRLRGFFTENVNMTNGNIPIKDVVIDISIEPPSKFHSDGDLSEKCKGGNGTKEVDLRIVSRKEWRARKPRRKIPAWDEPLDYIFVYYTNTLCLDNIICQLAMLKEQDDAFSYRGDIPANFYSNGDGIVYEGLGWERQIDDTFSLVYFLDGGNPPSPQQLQSFCLLIAQGIQLGNISPNFVVDGNSKVSVESKKWFNVIQELVLTIVYREEWNASQPTKEIGAWVKPLNSIYIWSSSQPCFDKASCMLRMTEEQIEDIPSLGDTLYNFYSGGDGLVYEGRGWDRVTDDEMNLVYFLDGDKPPSHQQMKSFGLLVAQGIKLGKISPNFTIRGGSEVLEISDKWFSVMKYA